MKNKTQHSGNTQTVSLKQWALLILVVSNMLICTNSGAQTFTEAKTYTVQKRAMVAFTVSHEANVRHYNIEAANDSANFINIALVQSIGNTMIPRSYKYDITLNAYKYYRVTAVYMNWQNEHSPIIATGVIQPQNPIHQNIQSSSQIVSVKKIQQ